MYITIILLGLAVIASFIYSVYNQKEITKKPIIDSIIGKVYLPIDNSYSVCLTDFERYYNKEYVDIYLAGTQMGDPQIICDIISEPFIVNRMFGGKMTDMEFIIVKDRINNKTHTVLYYDWCVKEELYTNIKSINKEKNYYIDDNDVYLYEY